MSWKQQAEDFFSLVVRLNDETDMEKIPRKKRKTKTPKGVITVEEFQKRRGRVTIRKWKG